MWPLLGKGTVNISKAKNKYTTTEEFLKAVFFM
jgi:hypothetical protein